MIHLFQIMELAKLQAIHNKLHPNESSIWRSICRDYSKTFSISLLEVSTLEPEKILLDLYEDQLETIDISEEKGLQRILENLYRIEDPDYDEKHEQSEKEANEKILAEELELEKKKAAKKAAKLKNTSEEKAPVKALPKAGGINLKYLSEQQDKEG